MVQPLGDGLKPAAEMTHEYLEKVSTVSIRGFLMMIIVS